METPIVGTQESSAPNREVESLAIVEALTGTRPWVRLVSILGFVMTAFLALVALVMPFFSTLTDGAPGLGFGILAFLLYGFIALVYGFLSLYLFRYSQSIGNFERSRSVSDLGAALGHQKSFWRLVGIVASIYLVLIVLGIGVAVIVGLIGAQW